MNPPFSPLPSTVPITVENEVLTLVSQGGGQDALVQLQDQINTLPADTSGRETLLKSVQIGMAIRERFEEYQQRERGLHAIIETAQDLIAIRDLDRVLQAIVHRARKLMGADIGYLSIYDPEQGDFYVRATDGAFSMQFKQIRVGRDTGICGYVARNKAPYSSTEYSKDPRFSHANPIDAAVVEEGIESILGVPLLSESDVIGVLFVGDRYTRPYNGFEISILSTLAAHASLAIENAHLFQQTEIALEQVKHANALLQKQSADTVIAAEAHEQLTSLVARGGGIQDLCEMAANMLDGHVTVIDEAEQPIHASSADAFKIAGTDSNTKKSQRSLHTRQDKIHAALIESRILGRSVAAFTTARETCRVSAVVGNQGLLGGLILLTASDLSEFKIRIFERSSMVTGVVLLSQERNDYLARQEIPVLFRGLLSQPQRNLKRLTEQAARHGLHLSQACCLAVVQLDENRGNSVLSKMRSGFRTEGTLFDEMDGSLVIISSHFSNTQLRQLLQDFFKRELRENATGVISKPLAQAADLPAGYRSMLRCLDSIKTLGRHGSILLEQELSLYAVLFDGSSADDLNALLCATLGKLYEAENPRKAELAGTLLSYLNLGHNARATASELGIHINTFRQRINAIDDLLGPWSESSRVLEIHVALQLWRLRDGTLA